jgi:hypothetical protein
MAELQSVFLWSGRFLGSKKNKRGEMPKNRMEKTATRF